MQNQQTGRGEGGAHDRPARDHARVEDEFPVREYVGAMASELAQMARWDGDERLACILDAAAEAAARAPGPDTKE